jgi:hypothetical protein
MQNAIVNLTSLVIDEELDYLLERYPYQQYQAEFALPEKRQPLVEGVLMQLPNRHVEMPIERLDAVPELLNCVSTQKRLRIESLLEQGIQALTQQKSFVLERNLACQ